MTTLRTASPATTAMKAVLPRFITPSAIAREASATAFAIMEPRFVTGTSSVSSVANLARPEAPFVQETAGNQPSMSFDPVLGRETLTFGADKNDHLIMAGQVNYATVWTMLVVAKVNSTTSLMHLLGDYGQNVEHHASVQLNFNGTFRGKLAEAAAGIGSAEAGAYYALMATHDGAGRVKSKRLGGSLVTSTGAYTTTPIAPRLMMGHHTTGWGLNGAIDMAAMFNVDILAPAQADLLSRVETMLRQYYGAAVIGGA